MMEGEGVGRVPGPKGGTSEPPQSTLAPGTGAAAARSIRVAGCYRRRSARRCTHGHQLNWLTRLVPPRRTSPPPTPRPRRRPGRGGSGARRRARGALPSPARTLTRRRLDAHASRLTPKRSPKKCIGPLKPLLRGPPKPLPRGPPKPLTRGSPRPRSPTARWCSCRSGPKK